MTAIDARIVQLLKEAREQLERERRYRTEPIAIVGIGCRFPGSASNPADFWQLLRGGTDATGDIPIDRWDAQALFDTDRNAAGKCYTKRGAFLDQIADFEPEFFGISPREALSLDPQQRLLLEVSWEALEDSGIPADSLRGSSTGVWVGLSLDDYSRHCVPSGDLERIDAYSALGNARSIAAGRIAYVLGLQGPVLQLDTACSSSLVAVHLACQSLRAGECELALVGGVSVMSSPEASVALCRLQALSADGRCKTFDASADGYGRGEGCGMIVLKKLSAAQAAGDRVYAVIRGSAVNHDGRSNGLTAPNGLAQESVIRAALANAGVEAASVAYVEAHGTGTLLGDPIEVMALSRVYGSGRSPNTPLYLGSVKTNIGHLEAAAGIAALIKSALCVSHGELVQSLHCRQPNPKIPWRDLPIRLSNATTAWPEAAGNRIAGVSSFGISGTNAHVLVQEAPAVEPLAVAAQRSAELVVLSAKTAPALRAIAGRLNAHLTLHPEFALGDVSYNLMATRAGLEHRRAFAVPTRSALLEALRATADDPVAPAGTATPLGRPKVAFVFPGQGSQWLGMGRQLMLGESSFAQALAECDRTIRFETGWSVIEELLASPESSRLERIEVVQPVLFAVQVALAATWRAWGVEPDAVVGHSMGEVAAAYLSGALSLASAAAVVCRRSLLLDRISGLGEMALVGLSVEEAGTALAGYERRLSVAVNNGKRTTVLSGDPEALTEVLAKLEARGIFWRRVNVRVASHSPQVDPLLEELVAVLQDIEPRPTGIPMHSTVTGKLVAGTDLTPAYWADNLREPVRFADAIDGLIGEGFGHFVEVSPHPVLVGALEDLANAAGGAGVAVGSLRRGQPERLTMLDSLGALHTRGLALVSDKLYPHSGKRLELPLYPWQRQRYWVAALPVERSGQATGHPLLGRRLHAAATHAAYEVILAAGAPSWLDAHRVAGRLVVPGAALLELLRAATEHGGGGLCQVSSVILRFPVLIPEGGAQRVQIVLTEGGKLASVYSQSSEGTPKDKWQLNATAYLTSAVGGGDKSRVDLDALRGRCPRAFDTATLYTSFAIAGLEYGAAFQNLKWVNQGEDEVLAEIGLAVGLDPAGYGVHPALLDAAFHAIAALPGVDPRTPLLPFEIGTFTVHRFDARGAYVHARLLERPTPEGVLVDLTLFDAAGEVLVEVKGLHARPVDSNQLGRSEGDTVEADVHCYRLDWREVPDKAQGLALEGRWVVVSLANEALAATLERDLNGLGGRVERVEIAQLAGTSADHVVCVWGPRGDAETAILAAQEGLAVLHVLAVQESAPKLWWVTHSAVAVAPGDDVSVAASTIWGLGRTVMQELPELRCTLIDIESGTSAAELLASEARTRDDEAQVAWRGGRRHVARLLQSSGDSTLPQSDNYRLETQHPGTLDGLKWLPAVRRRPEAGEVEIEVAASGLNFKDTLIALGLHPDSTIALGSECAGMVVTVGSGVKTVAVGNRVMALGTGMFARYATIDARLVTAAPAILTIEQAATLPVAFLTAWYALHDLAQLKPRERVLIHAAAGGVGMAAVQIAHWIGAKVYATASPSKWPTVHSMGVKQIANSRDTHFAEVFRSEGPFDVVLNSLAGEFVDASLSLLSSGGRFIEMGKTDVRDPAAVGAAFPGVTYRAFNLMDAGPERLKEMLEAVGAGFASQDLRPLPVRTLPAIEADIAFRSLAQGRSVGKIALRFPRPAVATSGTVLITGGLGALGLQVARGFASDGVRHLLLTSRHGLGSPGASEAVQALQALGAKVTVAAVDVADHDAMAVLLAAIPASEPLRGVVHAAGVLDDGVLSEQTPERFAHVMQAKVRGAWNLHILTRRVDLDLFVVFSSIAGTLGSAGQSGYAAANAFLDALASYRQALGLAGLSLAFGPWAEQGLAATRSAEQQARLAMQGFVPFSMNDGLRIFQKALNRPQAALVLASLNLEQLTTAFGDSIPALWVALLRPRATQSVAAQSFSDELRRLPEERRLLMLIDLVRTEVARILSMASPTAIGLEQPLKDLGLDSLMALELRNSLARHTSLVLSASFVFQHPTPIVIARQLLRSLGSAELGDGTSHASLVTPHESMLVAAGFEADAVLEPDILPKTTTPTAVEPANVLLTGATGFLGAFLLAELMHATRAAVTCVVRAPDSTVAAERVRQNLVQYGLWDEAFTSRLSFLPGDISQPLLGLDAAVFYHLSETVDAVYNNGAELSFVASYVDLKSSHINATRTILRFASLGRPKAIHHISSAAVFDASAHRGRPVSESAHPTEASGLYLGYSQCKWVTENLIWQGAARGIQVTVHRPGFIAGSSLSGAWNREDFLCRLLKSVIELGCMPGDLDLVVDFSPVDYVSRSIVYLSHQVSLRGRAFHLHHPRGVNLKNLAQILRSLGHDIREIPYWEWVLRIEAQKATPLYAFLPFLSERWPPEQLSFIELWQRGYRPEPTCEATLQALETSGIRCPELDADLMARYLYYFEREGLAR